MPIRTRDSETPDRKPGGWLRLAALICTALFAPLWIPLLVGAVTSRPVIDSSADRGFALNSPWDAVRYADDAGDESSLHEGFPTTVDPLAFRTTGGRPNDRALLRPAFAALAKVTSESDRALATGDRSAARRVLRALDYWARADAFRGSPRRHLDIEQYDNDPVICEITGEPWNVTPPEPVRSWSDTYVGLGPNGYGEPFFLGKMASGAAIAYLQIRGGIEADSEAAQRVKAWFRGDLMQFQKEFAIHCFQARRVTDHYGTPLEDRKMMLWGWEGAHNKVFCCLLSVAALAIAADDEASFQWAIEAFDFVLNQIEEDGTHLATLYEKGGKSLLYHNFIVESVVPLAVLAEANGHSFLSDPRLTRLVQRVTAGHADPSYFQQVSGFPQEHGPFVLGGTSGWTVIYHAYVGDQNVAAIASPRRVVYPLYAGSGRRIGGHPKYWYPEKVDPLRDWLGLAWFYAWVVGLATIASWLVVALRLRRREISAPAIAVRVLTLALILSLGVGFGWSYLLLRVI